LDYGFHTCDVTQCKSYLIVSYYFTYNIALDGTYDPLETKFGWGVRSIFDSLRYSS